VSLFEELRPVVFELVGRCFVAVDFVSVVVDVFEFACDGNA
jgi:hypothetical protein